MSGCCPIFLAKMVERIFVPPTEIRKVEHTIIKPESGRYCIPAWRADYYTNAVDPSASEESPPGTKWKGASSDSANIKRDMQMDNFIKIAPLVTSDEQ